MIYSDEMELINNEEFKIGEFIYMGMGKCNGKTVCLSVAYKINYCKKKAMEFVENSNGLITFYKINKVKVGELKQCDELIIK